MRFLSMVATQGAMPAEAIEEMNRDWPVHAAVMEHRGGLRFGRELSLPEEGVASVRVRQGETILTDGPFVETKEFLGGFGVFEADDIDEAIQVESTNPVARFHSLELRALAEDFRFGSRLPAFTEFDDAEGTPYLLTTWVGQEGPAAADSATWRAELEERGVFVMGGELAAPQTARTMRVLDGEARVSDGPFLAIPEFISSIDVVRSPDLEQATALAATHPLAQLHAIEVRPFYTGEMP